MPKVHKPVDFLQRITDLEERLAALERTTRVQDEVPFWPTSFRGLAYEDKTSFTTLWETILTPRGAILDMGLVLIGDQVGGVSTGGQWQVVLDSSTVAASGNVPANYTYQFPTLALDLTPYRAAAALKVQIQVRRTAGATTGGRYGGGGAIGGSIRYARLL